MLQWYMRRDMGGSRFVAELQPVLPGRVFSFLRQRNKSSIPDPSRRCPMPAILVMAALAPLERGMASVCETPRRPSMETVQIRPSRGVGRRRVSILSFLVYRLARYFLISRATAAMMIAPFMICCQYGFMLMNVRP